jgi:hypothetical protein
MSLSFVVIQNAEALNTLLAMMTDIADIKSMPGIGLVEALQLAVNDQYGAVTNAHQMVDKWLSFQPAGPDGAKIANARFQEFLEAKGVGVDSMHRLCICLGVAIKLMARNNEE